MKRIHISLFIDMDRFIQIDPTSKFKKTIIVDRDNALVELYSNFMSIQEANDLFKELKNLSTWKVSEIMTKDGIKKTPRFIMGLVNPENIENHKIVERGYEKVQMSEKSNDYLEGKHELWNGIWTPLLKKAHEKIKELTGETFDYAWLNYYRDGDDHIGWHSDKEELIGDKTDTQPTVASLSLGVTRDFMLRHIKDTRIAQNLNDNVLRLNALETARIIVPLKSGSLLLMKKDTQIVYHHQVPKRANIKSIRINITFRHGK